MLEAHQPDLRARESRMTMSKRPRRNHSALFKAKVAIDAVKGEKTEVAPEIWTLR